MVELVKEIKAKGPDGVALLYERYGKKLYAYAVSRWKVSEDEAWELVYKTLYKVMSVIDKYEFEDESKLSGLLFKIFINYLRNHYRDTKNKRIDTTMLTEQHEKMDFERQENKDEPLKKNPVMECLQKVLNALEGWQRIVLLMRAQDHPYEEIAPYVDKPAKQLKVYHLRLKKVVTDKTNECLGKK
jgi:RNA polymerase sigma-70 factor (ECF subfamily)